MKAAVSRLLLFVAGLLLVGWGVTPGRTGTASAAPPLVISATSTAEPPTRTPSSTTVPSNTPTNTPTNTASPGPSSTPTSTPTNTASPGPSSTPTNTASPGPSSTPTSPPTDTATPGPSSTPTEEIIIPDDPTRTPTATPTFTPAPGPFADPAINKTANRTTAQVGDLIEFEITVTNLGNLPAENVFVEDTLPSFLALEGVSTTRGEVSVNGSTVRVEIGTLQPGETVTIRITARVVAPATPPGNFNLATVSTTSGTDIPENNTSSVSLLVDQPATPTAPLPARLPTTGEPAGSSLLLVALGLMLIAASVLVRRRV